MNNFQNQYQPNPYQPLPNNQPYNQPPFNNQPNINQPNPLVNPAMFRGSVPNDQLIHNQNMPNKLSQEEYYNSGSLTQNARKSFVAKVYTLLSLQLLLTALLGYVGYNSAAFQRIFANTAIIVVVSVCLIGVTIVMACCTDFFKRHALPIFIIFTILMSLLVTISICGFQSKLILTAVAITLTLTIALTIYAWNTQSDLTGCGPYLMVIGLVLFIFGIVAIFWKNPIVQLIYSCLAAFVFAIYLVYDTELVLGKGRYSYSLDDTYLAAIQLYLDIINLFLNILRILSILNR